MEVAKPKYVWWDLDCLHVPRGRDPYEVRWIIESALNKKFGPGPVTIFAIGNLNRIPRRVFELISLAGIFMKHTPDGGISIRHDLVKWTRTHPAPAIMMLISDREYSYLYFQSLHYKGYTILRTYVNQKIYSPIYASDVWLWKSLLTDTEQETPRPRQELVCFETGWFCKLCRLGGQSFTDFTTHIKTRPHLINEWFAVHKDGSGDPADEDLAYLHSQLVKHVLPRKSCQLHKREILMKKQSKTKPNKHFFRKHKLKKLHTMHSMVTLLPEPHKDLRSIIPHKDLRSTIPHKDLRSIIPHKDPRSIIPHKDLRSIIPHKDLRSIVNALKHVRDCSVVPTKKYVADT